MPIDKSQPGVFQGSGSAMVTLEHSCLGDELMYPDPPTQSSMATVQISWNLKR